MSSIFWSTQTKGKSKKRESETWEHWQNLLVCPNREIFGVLFEAKAIARTIVMKAPITHLHLIFSLFFISDSTFYTKYKKTQIAKTLKILVEFPVMKRKQEKVRN